MQTDKKISFCLKQKLKIENKKLRKKNHSFYKDNFYQNKKKTTKMQKSIPCSLMEKINPSQQVKIIVYTPI